MPEVFTIPVPAPGRRVLTFAAPFRLVNSYGLFAVMTTTRPEIIMPPWVAPDQPRLDWQMWFAVLGSREQNPWFTNFLIRLLQGEPSVLRLLAYNPFPGAPPKYVRAQVYRYRLSHPKWWTREFLGPYFPPVSLR